MIAPIDAGPGRPAVDVSLGLKLKGSGWALAAAEQQIEPTGRFKRSEESVEQAAPVQNPA